MRRLIVLISMVLSSALSFSQVNEIQVLDLGDGYADFGFDSTVEDGYVYSSIYFWNGETAVSAVLKSNVRDSIYLSVSNTGATIDNNIVLEDHDIVVSGHTDNRSIRIVRRDKLTGEVTQVKEIEPIEPQRLFPTGIVELDSQYVIANEGRHDSTSQRVTEMFLYWLDKETLDVDTVIHVYSSPNGSIDGIQPYGDNGIVALVDTTFIPDWWMSGPNTSWVSRQLLTFDGHYQQRELYRVDEIDWAEQWGNCLVTLPNGNVVVTVAYSDVVQHNLECINPEGEVVWDYLFPIEWYTLIDLTNLSLADNGDILGSGLVNRSVPEIGILFRLSPDGELRWIRQYEMPAPERWMDISFADVNQLDDDRLVVVGHVTATETLDPTDGNYYPNQNTLIMTVDNDGCYNGDCSDIIQLDMEELIITSTADIAASANPSMTLYPNPASNTISIKGLEDGIAFEIITPTGEIRAVGSTDNGQIDIQFLDTGLYFLRIGSETRRFVKL